MERLTKQITLKFFFFTLFAGLFNLMVAAQSDGGSGGESTTTSTTKKTTTTVTATDSTAWYTSPWVWVVGAAVFILLLVALLSNRGRDTVTSDRVRVTKTVERDSGSGA